MIDISFLKKYDSIKVAGEKMFIVEKKGLCGVVEADGTELVPCVYSAISKAQNGKFVVRKNGKYGIIDSNNRVVLPIEYDNITFYGDVAKVEVAGKKGLFNLATEGKQDVEDPDLPAKKDDDPKTENKKKSRVSFFGRLRSTKKFEDVAFVEKDDKVAIVDVKEEIKPFECKYDSVVLLDMGRAIVSMNGKYGVVDENDNVVVPIIYDNYVGPNGTDVMLLKIDG